jgi:hypothetical protein
MKQRQHSATVHQLEELAHDAKPGEFMLLVHDLSQQRLMAGQPREELLHELEVFRGLLRDMGRLGGRSAGRDGLRHGLVRAFFTALASLLTANEDAQTETSRPWCVEAAL